MCGCANLARELLRAGHRVCQEVQMHPESISAGGTGYELRFQSLFNAGRAFSFPCDALGRVRLDAMSERARLAYQKAHALVGREYAMPAVLRSDMH